MKRYTDDELLDMTEEIWTHSLRQSALMTMTGNAGTI